jgi:5,10-methylene-tetrahydrofolate dehydrogenase/methenyl tetrahydrofolate cyclohydrolase
MLKPGCVVIDIGIRQVPQLDEHGRPLLAPDGSPLQKVVGDADLESVRDVAGWLTPVPGGVGPVTVAMLVHNTVVAARLQAGLAPDSGFAD